MVFRIHDGYKWYHVREGSGRHDRRQKAVKVNSMGSGQRYLGLCIYTIE